MLVLNTIFKNVGYFLFVLAKPVVNSVKQLRLQRNDFETLKIIGRGAFGEVSFYCFSCQLEFLNSVCANTGNGWND